MTNDELLTAMRGVANKGAESPHLQPLTDWLTGHLRAIPPGDKWDSRQLYSHLANVGVDVPAKLLNQAMWRLRDCNALPEGFWGYDNRRRFMGNPLVVWTCPPAPATVDEGIF